MGGGRWGSVGGGGGGKMSAAQRRRRGGLSPGSCRTRGSGGKKGQGVGGAQGREAVSSTEGSGLLLGGAWRLAGGLPAGALRQTTHQLCHGCAGIGARRPAHLHQPLCVADLLPPHPPHPHPHSPQHTGARRPAHLRLGRVLLQLVEGSRTEGVGADHGRLEALLLEPVGVLGAGGGLARACVFGGGA